MKKSRLILPILVSFLLVGCNTAEEESISSNNTEITSRENLNAKELIIEDKGIEVEGGSFDYTLKIKPDLTLTMDIDLSIVYQEIDGLYNLHYEIDEQKNHTMIVSGTFRNIVVNSPLVEQLHPGIVTKFVNICKTIGFFTPDENGSYEYIEDLCNDPQNWIRTNISEDSYSYKLDLKTNEGFSFVNVLSLLIYENEHGYSINFNYTLPTSE